MKQKKNLIIVLIVLTILTVVCAVSVFIWIFYIAKRNTTDQEKIVTRYEWIEMLGETFGITEYSNAESYFKDVDEDSPYFDYVQSAVEWEIIEDATNFEGTELADGEFIALTTMRTIGQYKVQIYLGTDEELTETDYLSVAYENALISEEQLKEYFTESECKEILAKAQEMNDVSLWKDDVVELVYQPNVKEIGAEDVITYSEETLQIEMAASTTEELIVGDIIVFEEKNTGLKTAAKIKSIDADGKISIVIPEMEEIYDSLLVSDVNVFGGDEIFEHCCLNSPDTYNMPTHLTNDDYTLMKANTTEFSGESEGVSFYVYSKEDKLYVGVENKNTKEKVEYLVETGLDEETEIKCAFDITNIQVGTQIDWTKKEGLEYANIMLYAEFVEKMNMNVLSEEKEIPLFKKPIAIPVGHGVASVNIECNLVISVEGEISIEAKLPVGTNLCYEKGKGIRNNKMEFSYKEPEIKISAELGIALCPELSLKVLKVWEPLSAEIEVGVKGSGEVSVKPSLCCKDLKVVYPLLKLEATVDSGVGLKYSKEWELITEENAKYKYDWHYEEYADGTSSYVEECTYGKEEEQGEKAEETADAEETGEAVEFEGNEKNDGADENKLVDNHVLQQNTDLSQYATYELPIELYLSGPIEDMGGYYRVNGRVGINYTMFRQWPELEVGDGFTILDKEFVLNEKIWVDGYSDPIFAVYCAEDDHTYYICTNHPETVGSRFGGFYYTVCYDLPVTESGEFFSSDMRMLSRDLGEQELIVNKDAYIVSSGELGDIMIPAREYDSSDTEADIFNYNEEGRRAQLRSWGRTVEECVDEKYLLDGWYDITDVSSEMRFFVTFDENGAIDSMIMESTY